MKFKTVILFFVCLRFLCAAAFAVRGDISLIDAPTAEVLPARTLGINTRVFSQGGMLAYFDFAVSNRFTIGASETLEHLIGSNDDEIKPLVPALQLKFRFYDGSDDWPALAAGFDNQGFAYNHDTDEYLQKARGVYLAASKEIFTPGLVFTPGVNVTMEGFHFDKLAVFGGAGYNIKDIVSLMLEWDNIRTLRQSRANCGLRVYIYDSFSIDFALRNFNNKAERVVQLRYSLSL
jgi:hypothetical protein